VAKSDKLQMFLSVSLSYIWVYINDIFLQKKGLLVTQNGTYNRDS
jgi:hypothetical protein